MTVPNPLKNADQKVRPQFREIARNIVAKDRYARKMGHSQNTIGEIERALVRAYEMGRDMRSTDASDGKNHSESAVDWISIPPRSRETLISMTTRFSERWSTPQDRPHEIQRFTQNGRVRWAVICDGTREDHSVADGSAAPLIRMGLIAVVDPHAAKYALTKIGIATCRDYWRRSDANDPTLPRLGMR